MQLGTCELLPIAHPFFFSFITHDHPATNLVVVDNETFLKVTAGVGRMSLSVQPRPGSGST